MLKSPELPCSSPLPLSQCLAKSCKTAQITVLPGRLVFSHCQIVGEVARALMMRMPQWLHEALFPDGAELVAAAHDIGKVSPTFQKKIYSALSQKDEAVKNKKGYTESSFDPPLDYDARYKQTLTVSQQ